MNPKTNVAKDILREKLLSKLDLTNPPRLVLIQAPSGYGKSVLARQIAQVFGRNLIWQSVDSWQRDVITLTSHAIQEIRQVFSLEDEAAPIPTTGQAAAHYLLQVLGKLKQPWVYVFDDTQNLLNHPAALVWLQTLVDHAPNACFILVGQQLPNLNLLQHIARGQVQGYGLEDLKFSEEEFSLLCENLGIASDNYDLFQQFDGWIAGIRIALQPLPDDVSSQLQQGETPEQLFSQLAERLFRSQSPDMQEFLLASSLFEQFSLADCYKALQLNYAQEQVEQALEQNLFLVKQRQIYQYHSLFKDFLQKKFQQIAPKQYLAKQIQIADYYAQEGDETRAVYHYVAGQASSEAFAIAEKVAAAYHVQGKLQILLRFIDWLWDEPMQAPTLWLIGAIIETDNYQFTEAIRLLSRAESEYACIGHEEGISRTQAQGAFVSVRQNKLEEAVQQCEKLLKQPNLAPAVLAWIYRVQGIALIELKRFDDAIDVLELAYKYAQDKINLAVILQDLSSAYIFAGMMDAASQILQDLVALRREINEPLYLALALNSLGYHYHCCSEYQLARACFEEGLSVLSHVKQHRIQGYLLWSLGDLERDCGNWQTAEQAYQAALQSNLEQDLSLKVEILLSLAHLRIWQQRWDDSIHILHDAEQLILEGPYQLLRVLIRVLRSIVLDFPNPPPEAASDLQRDIEEIRLSKAPLKLTQVLGLYLWFGLRQLNSEILYHVEQILAEIDGKYPVQALAADSLHIPQLGYYFESQNLDFPCLSDALATLKREIAIPASQSQAEIGINQIDIQTLGEFQVTIDGRPTAQKLWIATAARELFLYLYFNGSQRREQIATLFWPDMNPSRVRSNFHTTIYRAREALGEHVICFEDDRYFINPEIEVSSDAQRMRSLIERARPLPSRNAYAEDLYRRASQLYRGKFLPDINREWATALREQYDLLYLEALAGLANCSQARQDFPQAIQYYRQAIQESPYDENLYQGLMMSYAKLGDKQRLSETYKQLSLLLNQELAVEPSKHSYSLFQRLLNQ